MKRFSVVVALLLSLSGARAEGPDDQYIRVYNLIQEADKLKGDGQSSAALPKYLEAQSALQQFQKGYPEWNAKVISFRLDYVTAKIAAMPGRLTAPVGTGTKPAAPASAAPGQPAQPAPPADWEVQLNALKEQMSQMQADKAVLEAKLKESLAVQPAAVDPRELTRAEEKIKGLLKENELLQVSLAQGKAKPLAGPDAKALAEAHQALLENQGSAAAPTTPTTASKSAKTTDADWIKQLERERNDLQKQLAAANKELYSRKGKAAAARMAEVESQVTTLRSRLEVLEARQVPYTEEELALLKQPETKLAQVDRKDGRKSVKELPSGTVALVAEAHRYYANKQLDKAEETYLQVLQQDKNNVPTLANLAAIELDLGHLETAETNIKQAVALAPTDAYSFFVLGRLKFAQKQYDAAIDAFSRTAKLDPQDAQAQNFLGLALSEKGLRGPAETALRKAIQIDPNCADAHNNLAVVYLTQQPPAAALAQWHYKRALAAGHPHNPELEKMLDATKPAGSSQ